MWYKMLNNIPFFQIIDPWGCVVAQCHEGVDVCLAEIDLDYLHKVRTDMPVQQHRRQDLYGYIRASHIGLFLHSYIWKNL